MEEWRRIQLDMAARAELRPLGALPRFVAGVDAAFSRDGTRALAAVHALRSPFGAVLFDGMGIAHPLRCGIAVHMSVTLGVPGAGIGKSRLYGRHDEPGPAAGDAAPPWGPARPGDPIGWVLRTREKVRPVYVSPGHKADLASSLELARACLGGFRLPEPTRLADREVAAFKAALASQAAMDGPSLF